MNPTGQLFHSLLSCRLSGAFVDPGLGQREASLQAGSLPSRALDPKRSGERLDAVCEASEAVALRVGSADSVVAHLNEEGLVVSRRADLDASGSGVLLHVRERLGDDIVGGGLDVIGKPPVW